MRNDVRIIVFIALACHHALVLGQTPSEKEIVKSHELPSLRTISFPEPEMPLPISAQKPNHVVEADREALLAHPRLLQRAMHSALVMNNQAGVAVLLPIYRSWAGQRADIVLWAEAVVAAKEGNIKESIAGYRQLIALQPESTVIRYQLAVLLFEDRQNEAAQAQFERLQTERLPQILSQNIEGYLLALQRREDVKWRLGFHVAHDGNVNQAPSEQKYGDHWTFEQPLSDTLIHYHLGMDKKFSLKEGWYATIGADVSGKHYSQYHQYNDVRAQVEAGVGHAGIKHDVVLKPYHSRRFYSSESAYSYDNGLQLESSYWWKPQWQQFFSADASYTVNQQRKNSNTKNVQFAQSLVYYPSATQYWLFGTNFYRQDNHKNASDTFNRYGLEAGFWKEWGNGISSQVKIGWGQRRYAAPVTFFSSGNKRRDQEWNTSLTLWHRAWHFGGVTPKFTVTHHRTHSNDALFNYQKTQLFFDFSKTF